MTADLRERLALVTEYAGKLRAEGVTSLEIDGIKLELTPYMAPERDVASDLVALPGKTAEDLAKEAEAADEAATFGLPPGSKLPGFTRPPDLQRKADS